MSNDSTGKIKILFLAANPVDMDRLQLDEEVRAIDQELRAANLRDQFELESHWAVRYDDLHELFIRYSPTVVHFSGHGTAEGELVLLDEAGEGVPIDPEALANLFAIFHPNVRCTVLNACYTARQAEGIARHVACVVGTSAPISDDAAIDFAAGFYLGLASGFTVQKSFDLGRNRIELSGSDEEEALHLLCPAGNADEIVLARKKSTLSDEEQAALAAKYAQKAESFPPHTPARRGCYASVGRFSVAVVLSAFFVAIIGGWLWSNMRPGPATNEPLALPRPTSVVAADGGSDSAPPALTDALAEIDAAVRSGDYAAAMDMLTQAVARARASGSRDVETDLLLRLGEVARSAGDLTAAGRAYSEALEAAREAGDATAIRNAQAGLGDVALEGGELEEAEQRYSTALTLAREADDAVAEGLLLTNLAMVNIAAGDSAAAATELDQALSVLENVEVEETVRREIRALQRALP